MKSESTATRTWWPSLQKKCRPDTTSERDLAAAGLKTRRGFPAPMRNGLRGRRLGAVLSALLAFYAASTYGQSPPGTLISNQASASYFDPGGTPVTVPSNPVDIVTVVARTPATLRFNRVTSSGGGVPVGPTACAQGGGSFVPLPDPVLLGGASIDPSQPQNLTLIGQFHAMEPAFVTLSDLDQNLDPALRETVTVTVSSAPSGDSETLRLTETAVDSGLFAGYVQMALPPATAGDCVLQAGEDAELTGFYQDPDDAADTDQAQALVDPTSVVFDASSGNRLDGVTVRLVDAVSGAPATVFGSDGVSTFPAVITSGGTVSDSNGQTYAFPPGGYRFPVVPAGNYRIEIEAPAGYAGLSDLSITELQALPGAPFELDAGSFGATFVVGEVLAFDLDLPLDPALSSLYLRKSVTSAAASPGDFVQYALSIENTSAVDQTGVTIVDVLPVGFRLIPGSTYLDELSAADPAVSPDGRTLRFDIGGLAPETSVAVRYVTEVTVAAAGDSATNTARAVSATGVESNEASVTVQLVEDLFTSESILVGRTLLDACDADAGEILEGIGGLRVYMDDGRYAITDEGGRFHFDGLDAGTHVVQLDLETVPDHLEVVDCQTNSRFAGRSFSRFLDLRAGSLWRADFHLRERSPPTGTVALELDGERIGPDTIEYSIEVDGGDLPVDGLVVSLVLPDGQGYLVDSSRIGGAPGGEPAVQANTLSYRLGDRPAGWSDDIVLRARLTDDADGELIARAVASFRMPNGESGRTPVAGNQFIYRPELTEVLSASYVPHFANLSANLTDADRRDLDALIADWRGSDDVLLIGTGHTDSNPIVPGHPDFADNYALSLARVTAVARYVAERLGIAEQQLRLSGHGPDEPVADNATDEGRAKNRRVELRLERHVLVSPAELVKLSQGSSRVDTQVTGTHAIAADTDDEFDIQRPEAAVFSDAGFIETLEPATRWLAPDDDYGPPIPSLKIAIQHAPDAIVQLRVNGIAVDPLNFVGTELNQAKTVAISRWRGVDLGEGGNRLTAIVSDGDGDGTASETLETHVHYGGGPARALVDEAASRLIADGTTQPVIAVRLYDAYGEPARPSTTGAFAIDPPYRSLWEVESLTENQLVAVGDREPLYRVGPDGLAYLKLEPTTITGEATVRLRFDGDRQQELRVWMAPAPRDWILVGFAEGTLGYNTLDDNMVTAADAGFEDDRYTDGQVSFFAKGQVKGEYLMTLAYQSDIDEGEADNQLFGTIDPNRYYTLYGDTTEQRFEAASRRGLFSTLR